LLISAFVPVNVKFPPHWPLVLSRHNTPLLWPPGER
jgi:hypothetical protein